MAAIIGALRVVLGLDSAELETGMKKATGAFKGLSAAFSAIGGAAVFAGFTAGIGQAVGRIEEARKLAAQFEQALKNTGNTADTSGKQLADFADHIERETGRAAEEILAVGTNLATFGFNHDVFYNAIELANDMSAAWGGDLKQNMEGLARALADPEKGLAMLTKRGITFTDQQKQMIAGFMKSNDLISAQGVVMDALNEQVKGVAAAGFTGLTAAQARSTMALEEFFETVANAIGANGGLEMSLTAVAAALDFVSQNFDVIARAAGVAGAAVLTALGPTIWGVISSAAVAMSTAVVAGLRGIAAAAMANPLGFIVVGLAAVVSAAVLFRNEIKQVIGVDFVGIVQGAVNAVVGAFVGAFEGIKAIWSQIPAALGDLVYQAAENSINGVIYLVREAQVTIRGFLGWVDTQLRKMGGGLDLSGFTLIEYADLENPYAGMAADAAATFGDAFSGAQRDYLGDLGKALGLVGEEARLASANVQGFNDILDGAGDDSGGAAGGAKRLGAAADETKDKLNGLGEMGKSVASTLASGFKDIFKAVVTGSGNAMDAVAGLMSRLGDLALDHIFTMLVGGVGGGGAAGGGLMGLLGGLVGFARGGTILPGGSGGIDSQLVAFRKSPNERVDITKPGQTLSSGERSVVIQQSFPIQGAISDKTVLTMVQQGAAAAVESVKQQFPGWQTDLQVHGAP